MMKKIPQGSNEQRYLQLRVDAFNVFNHPQFYGINTPTQPVAGCSNGRNNGWDVVFNYSTVCVVKTTDIRPVGEKGNVGKYFGEYNNAGNERKLQLSMRLFF